MRFNKVIIDSSGNTGISVTLYSKLYGLKPLMVMPQRPRKERYYKWPERSLRPIIGMRL